MRTSLSQPLNSTQPELIATTPPAGTADVAWLEATLLRATGWLTAERLQALSDGRFDDRDIRALASASLNVVSGHRGYRHLRHCKLEDVERGCDRLTHQGQEMISRSLRLRRHAHAVLA